MAESKQHKNREITIQDLYPHLNEEQLKEAEETLERYIELSIQMYRRIKADPEAYAQFIALTDKRLVSRIKDKQSIPSNHSQM